MLLEIIIGGPVLEDQKVQAVQTLQDISNHLERQAGLLMFLLLLQQWVE